MHVENRRVKLVVRVTGYGFHTHTHRHTHRHTDTHTHTHTHLSVDLLLHVIVLKGYFKISNVHVIVVYLPCSWRRHVPPNPAKRWYFSRLTRTLVTMTACVESFVSRLSLRRRRIGPVKKSPAISYSWSVFVGRSDCNKPKVKLCKTPTTQNTT